MDIHKLASLLIRDYTIIAKRHSDMARDCRAIAGTWRQVLDATPPFVLKELSTLEDCMPGAPAVSGQESQQTFVDVDGNKVQ